MNLHDTRRRTKPIGRVAESKLSSTKRKLQNYALESLACAPCYGSFHYFVRLSEAILALVDSAVTIKKAAFVFESKR